MPLWEFFSQQRPPEALLEGEPSRGFNPYTDLRGATIPAEIGALIEDALYDTMSLAEYPLRGNNPLRGMGSFEGASEHLENIEEIRNEYPRGQHPNVDEMIANAFMMLPEGGRETLTDPRVQLGLSYLPAGGAAFNAATRMGVRAAANAAPNVSTPTKTPSSMGSINRQRGHIVPFDTYRDSKMDVDEIDDLTERRDIANALIAANAPAEDVHGQTGLLYRDFDTGPELFKQLRDDETYLKIDPVTNTNKTFTLGEVYNHPELYQTLPGFENIPISLVDRLSGTTRGQYTPAWYQDGFDDRGNKTIIQGGPGIVDARTHEKTTRTGDDKWRLPTDTPRNLNDITATIAHEVQHGIQHETGMPKGSSVGRESGGKRGSSFFEQVVKRGPNGFIREFRKYEGQPIAQLQVIGQFIRASRNASMNTKDYSLKERTNIVRMLPALEEFQQNISKGMNPREAEQILANDIARPIDDYWRSGGEADARLAGRTAITGAEITNLDKALSAEAEVIGPEFLRNDFAFPRRQSMGKQAGIVNFFGDNISSRNVDNFGLVSSRFPTSPKGDNPLSEILTLSTANLSPEQLQKTMEVFNNYQMYGKLNIDDAVKALEQVTDLHADNLMAIIREMPPEMRDRAIQWYEGANRVAQHRAQAFGVEPRAVAAAISALSPQTDWDLNVARADRVLEVMSEKPAWTPSMNAVHDALTGNKPGLVGKAAKSARGKDFADLETDLERAIWIRTFDEANNPRDYNFNAPEGDVGGIAMVDDQSRPSVMNWGSYQEIAKAVSVIRDPSFDNISTQLGKAHKIRNFFNNIASPDDPRFVTMDTHAIAADMLQPFGGNAAPVAHNFGTTPNKNSSEAQWWTDRDLKNPPSSSITGQQGTYPIHQEAYMRLGEDMGVIPRGVQSIAWEGVRSLFDNKSPAHKMAAREIWKRHQDGEITATQARREIFDLNNGIPIPRWMKE